MNTYNVVISVTTTVVGADQIVQWDTRYGEMTGKDNAICEE